MDKAIVIQKIVEALQSELEAYVRAAKFSHAEATAEENRAENKYDTRGLEASYLAAGQANKVVEIEQSLDTIRPLEGVDFSDEPIDVGALVELQQDDFINHYLIGPSAGGTEVVVNGTEILVITLESPLGEQLVGKREGDSFKLALAGRQQSAQVIAVC